MGYAIVRLAKRTARASVRSMLRHALREGEVPNALEGAPKPQLLAGDATSGAGLERLSKALKAAPRVQKNTVQALDFLVTASRADMLAMSADQQNDYFNRALGFIADRFGGLQNVLAAAIHRDESTPHMQVLVMPRDAEGRFVAAKMIGGPVGLRAMHDAFTERVGQRFGLLRGERGEHVKHVPIQQFYAQLAKAETVLPAYKPVPAAPSMIDKIKGKAPEIEAARAAATTHNKRVRDELAKRAAVAAKVHPSVIARQAERYREAVRLESVTASNNKAAKEENAAAGRRLELVASQNQELGSKLATMDKHTAAVLVAKHSKNYAPEFVQALAKNIGIPLVPGRDIPDQIRRAGHARTLDKAVEIMDRASDGHVVAAALRRAQIDAPAPPIDGQK